jgi:hypothetical protein
LFHSPHLGKAVNASVETIQRLLSGEFPGIVNLSWTITDVRDAALAHILAMENPAAEGRFLCQCCQQMLFFVLWNRSSSFPFVLLLLLMMMMMMMR